MKKIGILGGSFDPVHNAHLEMAECAVCEFKLDKVIFVPAYIPPHKVKLSASDADRYNMLSFAISKNDKFMIDTYEIGTKRTIYSYQTLDYLQKNYKDDKIRMIIGSDSFNQLNTWKNAEYIAEKYGFIVIRRPDIVINRQSIYYKYSDISCAIMRKISSTVIRNMVANKESICSMVSKQVLEYIKDHELYKK